MKIEKRLLLSLEGALKLLPGVKPRKAREVVKRPYEQLLYSTAMRKGGKKVDICGRSVSYNDLAELFVTDDWGTPKVTPKGAALLIDLYKRGAFPLAHKGQVPSDAPDLEKYAQSGSDLERKTQEISEKEERRRRLIEDPSQVKEEEFDYSLLNDIFFRHRGPGSHSMKIGGITVNKSITTYKSNSGKTSDSTVVFNWVSSDGERQYISKESQFVNNRRNDADRNWGLGRE